VVAAGAAAAALCEFFEERADAVDSRHQADMLPTITRIQAQLPLPPCSIAPGWTGTALSAKLTSSSAPATVQFTAAALNTIAQSTRCVPAGCAVALLNSLGR
jgi:hypothetical protein